MAKKKIKNKEPELETGKAPFAADEQGTATAEEKTETVATEADQYPGRVGPIGPEEVEKATTIFQRYREGKATLEARAIANQQWYRQRYAEYRDPNAGGKEPEEKSAWLFNSIANKHADAMDNIPCANILPREQSDTKAAETLSRIVPLVMDKADFEKKYDEAWYDKLIAGGCIYKPFWNNDLENGLGDIDIQTIDVLNVFWEPGEENIQDSRHFFHVEYENNDIIEEQYPFMKGKLNSSGANELSEYMKDEQGQTNEGRSLIYDWYYKKQAGTRTVVHYCRFCNGEILWASENSEEFAESGYYDHGMYPFVFDAMFPIKGSPFGFSYVDVMKYPQFYIDELDGSILKNATMASKPRWFKKDQVNVNMTQFADWSNDFIEVSGGQMTEESLKQVQVNPLPNYIINHHQSKIDELKETSGNRDFSQGSTTSGVTAASAIAALQEAGSKLSRDMLKASYRAYKEIVTMVVELMRQFYTEDRYFRVEQPNGGVEFVAFNNLTIREQQGPEGIGGEVAIRRPVFDFKISSQKQSPFSRTAQNELAKELFKLGVFNPAMADQVMPMLSMMDFEGIDAVKKTVNQNGMLYQQLLQMTQLATQFAAQLDNATGGLAGATQQVMAVAGQGQGGATGAPAPAGDVKPVKTDSMGLPVTDNTQATKARLAAANRNTPK